MGGAPPAPARFSTPDSSMTWRSRRHSGRPGCSNQPGKMTPVRVFGLGRRERRHAHLFGSGIGFRQSRLRRRYARSAVRHQENKRGGARKLCRAHHAAQSSSFLARASRSRRASWCGLSRATAVMPWKESKKLSGLRSSSASTVWMSSRSWIAEAALAQELGPVLVGARGNALARLAEAVDERMQRGVGEAGQRGHSLMREARGRLLRVPDCDPLGVLHAPEIRFWHSAEIEARDPSVFAPTSELQ